MQFLLIILALFLTFSGELDAQSDFESLNERSYNYYLKGDLRNLEKTADTMFLKGIDFYYLRMRLAIISFNNQHYSSALKHFNRAIEFNFLDTVSGEYIYKSYLFSGRKNDAILYLESIPPGKKNNALRSIKKPGLSEIFINSTFVGYDVETYPPDNLNYTYAALKNSLSFQAGIESFFSARFKGTFAYTNFRKEGMLYSSRFPSGTDLKFIQNQLYTKLTYCVFPGWEFSGFGHFIIFSDTTTRTQSGSGMLFNQSGLEYIGGIGISKNGWKIRAGANMSMSNFANTNQIRGEAYLTWLPSGNLNFYLTSGWMGQTDDIWGGTYQINQELGFKVLKSLWVELGLVNGNSFLYARNLGYLINNSFQIPANTLYGNIIILPANHLSITLTPFYVENINYSWDIDSYTRVNKLENKSFGGTIKFTYKHR